MWCLKFLYQNFCGKISEGRHSQSVRILQLYLQQRVTQGLHTASDQNNQQSVLVPALGFIT